MIIEIRKGKNDPTYMVRINDEVWEMGVYADQPNGVCIFSGPVITEEIEGWDTVYPLLVEEVPIGICRQIMNIIESDNEYNRNNPAECSQLVDGSR